LLTRKSATSPFFALGKDVEDDDEYVVLDVTSSGDQNTDLESYFKYIEEWSSSVVWPASRMILLDLKTMSQNHS
jgi:hypothetical protein